ncbi:MAG: ankyrin repeat domain-containing protein [Spirochaetales bacterium]
MDLLVLYTDRRTDDFQQLERRLSSLEITSHGLPVASHWSVNDSEDVLFQLKEHSHYLFLLGEDELAHPMFIFASGYFLALGERSFIWESGKASFPGFWGNTIFISRALDDLLARLIAEKQRWKDFLERLEAKGQLLERGFEVTPSALFETVEKGDTTSVELFLKAGFTPDQTNKKGVSLLGLAIRFSHLSVLRLLLQWGADINLRSRDRDNTPVMDAAAEGHLEMLQELIQKGADLAGQSRNGQNALVLAIGKGADAVSRVLLEAGADPFVDDKLGMSALKYAQMFGRKEIVEMVSTMYPGRM